MNFQMISVLVATLLVSFGSISAAVAKPVKSTRGASEFEHAGERSFENEFPKDSPRDTRPSTTETATPTAPLIPTPVSVPASSESFMTVHANPFTSLLGLIYADVGFEIKDQFTVGPALRIAKYNLFFLREDSIGAGLRMMWFNKSPFASSFYVATTPLFSWGEVTSRAFSASAAADFSRFQLDLIGGYQWHWTNFNLGIGFGIAYNAVSLSAVRGEAGNLKGDIPTFGFTSAAGLLPTAELSLGWSF